MQIKKIKVDDLKPYEKNPRINESAIEKVAMSIINHGFNQPIVADSNLRICVGHTRWLAAKQLDYKEVPVYVKEMTEQEFIAYNLADNKTGEFSTWDEEKLGDLMAELESLDTEMLMNTGFSEAEIEELLSTDDLDDLVSEVPVTGHTRTVGGEKAHVKMVQLFFNDITFPKFIEMCEAIQAKKELKDLTDTVFAAVEEVHKGIK